MPPPSPSRFGKLLREFRERAGLSQRNLAAYLNIGCATISKIETGSIKPPLAPAFYECLRTPGFTEADMTRLLEARYIDKSTEDLEKYIAKSGFIMPEALDNKLLAEVTQNSVTKLLHLNTPWNWYYAGAGSIYSSGFAPEYRVNS
jgi:transcriptional regulator with XRE-family HTH domain